MTTPRYSWLNSSRMTRTAMSGSRYSSAGAGDRLASASIWSHCRTSRVTSRSISSAVTFSAAVRTMTPCCGGLDLVEDGPQALALVVGQPLRDAVGGAVRDEHDEPARQRDLLGEAGALVPIGFFVTWQRMVWRALRICSMRAGRRPSPRRPRRRTGRRPGRARRSSACRCRRTPPPCRAARSGPGRGRCCRGSG